MMDSRTYGDLPSYPDFRILYEEAMKSDGSALYKIRSSSSSYASQYVGDYNARELFALLVKLKVKWENGGEEAGHLASDIMSSLGIKWV
jgi:hypothetical protein